MAASAHARMHTTARTDKQQIKPSLLARSYDINGRSTRTHYIIISCIYVICVLYIFRARARQSTTAIGSISTVYMHLQIFVHARWAWARRAYILRPVVGSDCVQYAVHDFMKLYRWHMQVLDIMSMRRMKKKRIITLRYWVNILIIIKTYIHMQSRLFDARVYFGPEHVQ